MSLQTNGNSYLIATDRYTSIESRSQNPVSTKSGLQIIALLTLKDSSITFSLKNTGTRPIHLRDPLVLLGSSIKNPKSKTIISEETKQEWIKEILKQTCISLYMQSLRQEKTHPFPLNSATHRGFVAIHFPSENEKYPGFYQEFVTLVGQGPVDMNRLPEIHSFLFSKDVHDFTLFDSYIQTISPQPKVSIETTLKASEAVTELTVSVNSLELNSEDIKQESSTKLPTDEKTFDVIEDYPELEYDMGDTEFKETAPAAGRCLIS
jgi:hypothetical protein